MTSPMMDRFTAVRHGDTITFKGMMWAPTPGYALAIEPASHDNLLPQTTYPLQVSLEGNSGGLMEAQVMTPTEGEYQIHDPSGLITKIRVYSRDNRSYDEIAVTVSETN